MKIKPLVALRALRRIIWASILGLPVIAPEDLMVKRLRRCQACPKFDEDFGQCKECSCFVKVKVMLTTEGCPRGFW